MLALSVFFNNHETAIIATAHSLTDGPFTLPVHRQFEHVRRYVALVDELCIILSDVSVQVLTSQRLPEDRVTVTAPILLKFHSTR